MQQRVAAVKVNVQRFLSSVFLIHLHDCSIRVLLDGLTSEGATCTLCHYIA